ncbi:MAG: hypothetical protein PHV71_01515 [Eubacteriales bacterium]|nr:hypothetical protein [Eubacteriales bacterium]MDD3198837.1 hypothetical protein [Eubacteriales bacterium]MDD4121896.1 hypothetical protein [Eubacteriales bacterium]MDD4629264.1 hypothetical protein [Eubacteriales bacterium]
MNIKELKFPTVYDMDTVVGYGGNQEWFSQNIKRKAGCGCTSGANLAAYYAARYPELPKIYDGNTEQFDRNEYIEAMEEMYTYMKPGLLGFPYVKKFGRQFIKFCREHNIIAKAEFCYGFKKREEAFAFVKESIDTDNPVALLILFHRSHALIEDNWHWVTITGYIEDKEDFNVNEILFSNCGERQIVRANQLFEIHRKNTIRMVRFRIIGSNE